MVPVTSCPFDAAISHRGALPIPNRAAYSVSR